MESISLKTLLEAGCHFGHKSERWHPKAAQFIYQERDGIHIIDLAKTKTGLENAGQFLKQLAKDGKTALFVGTKRQALTIIREECASSDVPHIRQSWIGGFLTNWDQVHKNLEKIRKLTDEEKTDAWKIYPKHERVKLSRYLHKLLNLYGGVIKLMEKPDVLIVVDVKREDVAVREALRTGIPVVGIVDTNSDPAHIDHVIPANDDAVGSIRLLIHYLTQAYKEGMEEKGKEFWDSINLSRKEIAEGKGELIKFGHMEEYIKTFEGVL